MPIKGARAGSRKRTSREGTGAGNTDSHTQEQEEWDQASQLKAQSRGGQERGGIKSKTGQAPVDGARDKNGIAQGKNGPEPGDPLRPGPSQAEQPTAEQHPRSSRRSSRAPATNKSSHKTLPVKADHSQGLTANLPDSRTGSGAGHTQDTRGPRAFHHNEDDSTHLNQAYVERVLAMGQLNGPVNYPKYLPHQ